VLAKPTLLLAPSQTERDAVLQASSLLFLLARGDADRRRGAGAGLRKLHTAGCDAEQVWGQLEVGGLTEHGALKREVKTLLKSQDLVSLVPEGVDEDEDDDADGGDSDDGESGSDDEMAREAAKMRRIARGEAVSEDEDGESDEDESEDGDEDEDGGSAGRTGGRGGSGKAAKGKAKSGSDAFWDDMEKFVQQGEDEEAEEEEERAGKKAKGKKAVEVTEARAGDIEFVVTGCGTEDVEGVYRRNDKICKFGIAYSKGAYTLLFERGGTKLTNKDLKKKQIEKSRWILFSDDNGVYGDEPYYEAAGSFEHVCRARFKCKVGAAPGPQLSARPASKRRQGDEDEDDEDEEEEAAWEGHDEGKGLQGAGSKRKARVAEEEEEEEEEEEVEEEEEERSLIIARAT
jgi:hypothetical protein